MKIQKRYLGIIFCALWISLRYGWHLWYIRSFIGYKLTFIHFMPEWLVIIRYMFSFMLRIVGIFICTGLLFLKERYRIALMCLCWFNLLTVYFKHPYQTIYLGADHIWRGFPVPGKFFMSLNLSQEQLTWAWVGYFIWKRLLSAQQFCFMLLGQTLRNFLSNIFGYSVVFKNEENPRLSWQSSYFRLFT